MTTKSNTTNKTTTTVTPVVEIPAGTPRVAWSVKGRGKSATYCAGLPAGTGNPGQAVAMVAASGAVTFGNLTELRETVDGVSRWDFTRDDLRMTPAVKAANRAAKALGNAAYWQSDAGLATAQRIAERNARRSTHVAPAITEAEHAATTEAEAEAAAYAAVADAPWMNALAAPAVDIAAMVAAMIAAGMDGAAIGAAVAAATSAPTMAHIPTVAAPKAPRAKAPRLPVAKPAGPAVSGTCEVCGKAPATTVNGAHTACGKCASLDTDTAAIRAKRTAARNTK